MHAAKNTAIVSDNGAESSAADTNAISLLSTSDFAFSKVWANGAAASGAQFTVKNSKGKYLQAYTADSGWTWGDSSHEFAATTSPNLYSFTGLGDGTYTVSESTVATGASDMKPSFTVTIDHGNATPATATSTDVWGLVATSGSTVPSGSIAAVTNVHNITELPKTGAAGIILVVAIIVLLFAGAFLLISLYRRKAIANR